MMILKESIDEIISRSGGAIPLDRFLSLCISHYYNNRDPFGAAGDFITAPEISQMFGEMVGMWCVHAWQLLGHPQFNLVEIGGGRGTLMSDILRATKHVAEFSDAIQSIYMVETSEKLRDIQKTLLSNKHKDISWCKHVREISKGKNIIINNEFFDALPIKQFLKVGHKFRELYVTKDKESFRVLPFGPEMVLKCDCMEGGIVEISPAREAYASEIVECIREGGACLSIDYGYSESTYLSTLQAVSLHKSCDIFYNLGNADLTSHVDFAALCSIFNSAGMRCVISTQGDFLKSYGIELRAQQLAKKGADIRLLELALDRLLSDQQMGSLFKVLEVYSL